MWSDVNDFGALQKWMWNKQYSSNCFENNQIVWCLKVWDISKHVKNKLWGRFGASSSRSVFFCSPCLPPLVIELLIQSRSIQRMYKICLDYGINYTTNLNCQDQKKNKLPGFKNNHQHGPSFLADVQPPPPAFFSFLGLPDGSTEASQVNDPWRSKNEVSTNEQLRAYNIY